MKKGKDGFYAKYIKRILDILLSLLGIIILSIPMLIVAILIKIDDPEGPVLFNQERIGRHGKIYIMHKFRSMRVGAEFTGTGVYSDDTDPRQTKIGKFIRKTSIDELPQLFNILKGEMSVVGFRSPLTYHPWPWEEYSQEQLAMFNVRPGITGWAQVHGRKQVEWNRRIEMNIWYSENVSFFLDVKILFMTVITVLKASDNENIGATV